jgi:hypothetical protein
MKDCVYLIFDIQQGSSGMALAEEGVLKKRNPEETGWL